MRPASELHRKRTTQIGTDTGGNFVGYNAFHTTLPPNALKAYDTDVDGRLNTIEWASVRNAISAGKLTLANSVWPSSTLPTALAAYDTDKSGDLSTSEWDLLIADISAGKLILNVTHPEPASGWRDHHGRSGHRD